MDKGRMVEQVSTYSNMTMLYHIRVVAASPSEEIWKIWTLSRKIRDIAKNCQFKKCILYLQFIFKNNFIRSSENIEAISGIFKLVIDYRKMNVSELVIQLFLHVIHHFITYIIDFFCSRSSFSRQGRQFPHLSTKGTAATLI